MKPDLLEKKRMSGLKGQFWPRKRQPALTLGPENDIGARPSKYLRTAPKVCPKISQSGKPGISRVFRGKPLFSAL